MYRKSKLGSSQEGNSEHRIQNSKATARESKDQTFHFFGCYE